MAKKRVPNPIDRYVGSRIRMQRLLFTQADPGRHQLFPAERPSFVDLKRKGWLCFRARLRRVWPRLGTVTRLFYKAPLGGALHLHGDSEVAVASLVVGHRRLPASPPSR